MSVTGWWRVCVPTHPSCHRHSQWLHQFVAIIPSIGKNGEKRGVEDWGGCLLLRHLWMAQREGVIAQVVLHAVYVCEFSVAKDAKVMVTLTVNGKGNSHFTRALNGIKEKPIVVVANHGKYSSAF